MKKLLLAVACGIVMTGTACAELPDFTKVWQDIRTGKLEQAEQDIDALWNDYKASRDGKTWETSHSRESSADVEEWLHFNLLRFYVAHLRADEYKMNQQDQSIQQLSYLEYMGKQLVD